MLYHLDAWLTRPPVPLRHRRSGVPLSLHSFGTLRATPWRRTSPRKISPLGSLLYRTTKPCHPELDSGSVPPSVRSLSVAKKAIVPRACRRDFFAKKNVTCKRPGNILKQDYRAARKWHGAICKLFPSTPLNSQKKRPPEAARILLLQHQSGVVPASFEPS